MVGFRSSALEDLSPSFFFATSPRSWAASYSSAKRRLGRQPRSPARAPACGSAPATLARDRDHRRCMHRPMSALERITDSSQTSRHVSTVPTCDNTPALAGSPSSKLAGARHESSTELIWLALPAPGKGHAAVPARWCFRAAHRESLDVRRLASRSGRPAAHPQPAGLC
jgi:hypothetical protein